MTVPPSGEQHELRFGEQHATVVEVGGGVRTYTDAGREVLDPYGLDEMCPGAHGTPLVPWPNRLGDGRYRFDDVEHQVALTEPELGNAIHGLARWSGWHGERHTDAEIAMVRRQHPQTGYPFTLDYRVTYRLAEDGLTVTAAATNAGATPAPYGYGHHPYLSTGGSPVDGCTLQLDAATRILTSTDRKLPVDTEAVAGTRYDFRGGRSIGTLEMDYAFTDLQRDPGGRTTVRFTRPDGVSVELWVDESVPFVELFTADSLAGDRHRRCLGVEPMTCPPNAFTTGDHVQRLVPGASSSASWGVRLAAGGDADR